MGKGAEDGKGQPGWVGESMTEVHGSAKPSAACFDDPSIGSRVFIRRHRSNQRRRDMAPAENSTSARLNAVCPYYTMFPLSFPLSCMTGADSSQWVLDPFCGRGTTLFAARLLGLPSVGIDSNPIAAAVAAAKLAEARPEEVRDVAKGILGGTRDAREVPQDEFWALCFNRSTLRDICIIREHLLHSCSEDPEIVLRALMLGILHGPIRRGMPTYFSNQMPRTYATKPAAAVRFWKRTGTVVPPEVDVLEAISRRASHVLAETTRSVGGVVYFGDARRAHSWLPRGRKFSWVITSPPYLGLRSYRSDQWLRNWFLGGPPSVDYRRDGQLVHDQERFSEELSKVWRSVASRCLPGARLVVRFGALRSSPVNARVVLLDSLRRADVGWRVYRWKDAGSSSNGNRQAHQFGKFTSAPISEIDAYARLEA